MMKPATLLLAVLLTCCASATPETAEAAVARKTMTPRLLQQGSFAASSNERPTVLVARDAATYERLWNVAIGSGKAPLADFTKESVVFLIDQQRNTGGYSIEPDTVSLEGSVAAVKAVVKRPGRDHVVTQVLTVPFAVVAVPKANVASAKWVDADGKVVAEDRGKSEAAKQK